MNDSVKLVEQRVATLVEHMVTEMQTASQNNIQNVNIEIKSLWEQLVAGELSCIAKKTIHCQIWPMM
jgi:hypothetical protein